MAFQGRRSRSGRPGDHRTNILTDSIVDPLLAGEKLVYCLLRSMRTRMSLLGLKRELRRPENKQILNVMATHSRPALLGILNSDWLACIAPSHGSPGARNRPWTLISLRCRREMNQNPVTMPGLKQKLVVLFWIQNSLRSHLTASNLPGGACPRLPYLHVYANVCT